MFEVDEVKRYVARYEKRFNTLYDRQTGREVRDSDILLRYTFCQYIYERAQSIRLEDFGETENLDRHIQSLLEQIQSPHFGIYPVLEEMKQSGGNYERVLGPASAFDAYLVTLLQTDALLAFFRLMFRREGLDILDFRVNLQPVTYRKNTRHILTASFEVFALSNSLPLEVRHPYADEINALLRLQKEAKSKLNKEVYDRYTKDLKLILTSVDWTISNEAWSALDTEQKLTLMRLKRKLAMILEDEAGFQYWDSHLKMFREQKNEVPGR